MHRMYSEHLHSQVTPGPQLLPIPFFLTNESPIFMLYMCACMGVYVCVYVHIYMYICVCACTCDMFCRAWYGAVGWGVVGWGASVGIPPTEV